MENNIKNNMHVCIYIYTHIYIYMCVYIYIFIFTFFSIVVYYICMGFSGGTVVKNLPANAGDTKDVGSIHGLGRFPGGGNGNPL